MQHYITAKTHSLEELIKNLDHKKVYEYYSSVSDTFNLQELILNMDYYADFLETNYKKFIQNNYLDYVKSLSDILKKQVSSNVEEIQKKIKENLDQNLDEFLEEIKKDYSQDDYKKIKENLDQVKESSLLAVQKHFDSNVFKIIIALSTNLPMESEEIEKTISNLKLLSKIDKLKDKNEIEKIKIKLIEDNNGKNLSEIYIDTIRNKTKYSQSFLKIESFSETFKDILSIKNLKNTPTEYFNVILKTLANTTSELVIGKILNLNTYSNIVLSDEKSSLEDRINDIKPTGSIESKTGMALVLSQIDQSIDFSDLDLFKKINLKDRISEVSTSLYGFFKNIIKKDTSKEVLIEESKELLEKVIEIWDLKKEYKDYDNKKEYLKNIESILENYGFEPSLEDYFNKLLIIQKLKEKHYNHVFTLMDKVNDLDEMLQNTSDENKKKEIFLLQKSLIFEIDKEILNLSHEINNINEYSKGQDLVKELNEELENIYNLKTNIKEYDYLNKLILNNKSLNSNIKKELIRKKYFFYDADYLYQKTQEISQYKNFSPELLRTEGIKISSYSRWYKDLDYQFIYQGNYNNKSSFIHSNILYDKTQKTLYKESLDSNNYKFKTTDEMNSFFFNIKNIDQTNYFYENNWTRNRYSSSETLIDELISTTFNKNIYLEQIFFNIHHLKEDNKLDEIVEQKKSALGNLLIQSDIIEKRIQLALNDYEVLKKSTQKDIDNIEKLVITEQKINFLNKIKNDLDSTVFSLIEIFPELEVKKEIKQENTLISKNSFTEQVETFLEIRDIESDFYKNKVKVDNSTNKNKYFPPYKEINSFFEKALTTDIKVIENFKKDKEGFRESYKNINNKFYDDLNQFKFNSKKIGSFVENMIINKLTKEEKIIRDSYLFLNEKLSTLLDKNNFNNKNIKEFINEFNDYLEIRKEFLKESKINEINSFLNTIEPYLKESNKGLLKNSFVFLNEKIEYLLIETEPTKEPEITSQRQTTFQPSL